MKKLFTFFAFTILVATASAQSVGIGTTTPNPSALLHMNSTTKGLLIPSMTTSQRFAINNPANGLMVYDTDKNECYHYNGSIWRPILNGDYWLRGITNRDRIGNLTDSVGIGTVAPTQRLDVNGNIRTRDDVLADGRVIATGTVSGSGLQTSGALTVASNALIGGNFTANGELATNGDLTINNSGATLQLKNGSSVNKGFYQIAGDDVRFGTNSGNTLGDVYVRMNGANRFKFEESGRLTLLADNNPTLNFAAFGVNKALLQVQGEDLTINAPGNKVRISNVLYVDDATNRVGVGTISPTERLHVSGNALITGNTILNSGRITTAQGGPDHNMLAFAYGKVDYDGSRLGGSANFTSCNRVGLGDYNIFVQGVTSSSIILVSQFDWAVQRVSYMGANWIKVQFMTVGTDPRDNSFSFVIYNP